MVSLAAAPDGTCYAAVIASEASLVDQAKDQAAAPAPGARARNADASKGGAAGGQPQVSVSVEQVEAPTVAAGRKAAGAASPRSEILSISPAGVVESLWSFADDTVYGLLWQNGKLWVATGLEGKLYRWADPQMLLEKDVDERQIVAVLPGEPGPGLRHHQRRRPLPDHRGDRARAAPTPAPRSTPSRWPASAPSPGRGRCPPGGAVALLLPQRRQRRAGPHLVRLDRAARGQGDLRSPELPRGRFVQWRAELRAAGDSSPRIYETELSYRQENLSPKIGGVVALDPGQILVPANFNPTNQVFEPAHPNREGIFTTLDLAADDDSGGGRNKLLWKLGYQTLRWTAADPNGDDLVYDLSFRPAEGEKGDWLEMVKDLKDDHYSFDALSLPDGVYRFRLRASDKPSNDPDTALVAERVSEPVVIDHTPPGWCKVEKDGTASTCGSWCATPRTPCARPSSASTRRSGSRCRPPTGCSTGAPRPC